MRSTWRQNILVGANVLALVLACSSANRDFKDSAAEAGASGASGSGDGASQAGEASGGDPTGDGGNEMGTNQAGAGGAGGSQSMDPCRNETTCDSPPGEKCEGDARVVYAETGTCDAGDCNYESTRTPCDGGTPRCRENGATSECVECLSDEDCEGSAPVCDTDANTCVPRPSCNGLAATCGPSGNEDCCASSPVTGGTFYRGYDGATNTDQSHPATISNFRLDNYEITVGRFRKFLVGYSQSLIEQGAGANPNNPADTGWNTAWNASLPSSAVAVSAALKCDATYQTWTTAAGTNESRPLNCLTWYEAQAFCIWDGGRLPTEAEWNYAAAGGTEQRLYPWGATEPGANAALAVYGCYFNGSSTCTFLDIAPVGSVSAGKGKYGQFDLAGNVSEWIQDWDGAYPTPCIDCASLTPGEFRIIRGGHFDDSATYLGAAVRFDYSEPEGRSRTVGARCARSSAR
jgi:sulfatase modifying factor 1